MLRSTSHWPNPLADYVRLKPGDGQTSLRRGVRAPRHRQTDRGRRLGNSDRRKPPRGAQGQPPHRRRTRGFVGLNDVSGFGPLRPITCLLSGRVGLTVRELPFPQRTRSPSRAREPFRLPGHLVTTKNLPLKVRSFVNDLPARVLFSGQWAGRGLGPSGRTLWSAVPMGYLRGGTGTELGAVWRTDKHQSGLSGLGTASPLPPRFGLRPGEASRSNAPEVTPSFLSMALRS